MKIQNKHGDVPITILVIGVFSLCTLALLSFYFASVKIGNAFAGVNMLEDINSLAEKIKFYEINNLNLDFGETKNGGVVLNTEKMSGYYSVTGEYKISEGIMFWKKDKNLIKIEYRLSIR